MLRLLLCLLALLAPVALAAPRSAQQAGFTRAVLELPHRVPYTVTPLPSGVRLRLEGLALPPEASGLAGRELTRSQLSRQGQATVWTLSGSPRVHHRVFTLPTPQGSVRLVVDYGAGVPGPSPAPPQGASAPAPQAKPRPTPLRVVLDPGHGGVFPGMQGYVSEKVVTLAVARRVQRRLAARGVQVELTRTADTQLAPALQRDLDLRAQWANAGRVHAFVSIHVNSGPAGASGVEVYHFGKPLEASTRALAVRENGGGALGTQLSRQAARLAETLIGNLLAQTNLQLSARLAREVQGGLVRRTGAGDRGVRRDLFWVIRFAHTPAILAEIGFGSNPLEGRRLAQADYQEQVAQGIAEGVLRFLGRG